MQSKRYQIFLSSTFSDLADERRKVMQSLLEMDCIPSGMEFFPASNDETFEFIKTVIDESDYYIIIVSARYGSVADDGLSYTEKEYDYAVSSGIPVLGFIRNDISDVPLSKTDRDEGLSNKLQAFRRKVLSSGRLCKLWSNPDELAGQVISTLNQAIRRHPRPGWIRGDKAASAELLASIHGLRTENDLLKSNTVSNTPILSIENLAGLDDKITIDVLAKYEGSSRTVKTKISISFKDLLGAIGHRYRTPHTLNSNNDLKSFINQFMDTEYVEFEYIWVRKIITQLSSSTASIAQSLRRIPYLQPPTVVILGLDPRIQTQALQRQRLEQVLPDPYPSTRNAKSRQPSRSMGELLGILPYRLHRTRPEENTLLFPQRSPSSYSGLTRG